MHIYLVRHGESLGNTKPGFISGRSDLDGLTNKGKLQIIRLAWELRNKIITKIITSPVKRAKESAEIMSNLIQTPVSQLEVFTELNHGIFEGHYWWEMKDKIPPEWLANFREDFSTPYPQGESFEMLLKRVWNGFDQFIQAKDMKKNYMIITHQAVIAVILYKMKNNKWPINPEKLMEFIHQTVIANGSYSKLIISDNKSRLIKTQPVEPVRASTAKIRFYIRGIMQLKKDIKLTKLTTISKNRVYRLNNAGNKLLKILSDTESLSANRLIKIYKYLATNSNIPAPKILMHDMNKVFFTDDIIIQDYVQGNNQNYCLAQHPQRISAINGTLYKILNKIHSIPVKDVNEFWFPNDWPEKAHPTWSFYLETEIMRTMRTLSKFSMSVAIKRQIFNCLLDLIKYTRNKKYRKVPLHGDLSPQNLIVDHRNGKCMLIRIVDFERARIGDGIWDYVYYYGWLERANTQSAEKWRNTFWQDLTSRQQNSFWLYRTLFHAWTVRDMLDYRKEKTRSKTAMKSLTILNKSFCKSLSSR